MNVTATSAPLASVNSEMQSFAALEQQAKDAKAEAKRQRIAENQAQRVAAAERKAARRAAHELREKEIAERKAAKAKERALRLSIEAAEREQRQAAKAAKAQERDLRMAAEAGEQKERETRTVQVALDPRNMLKHIQEMFSEFGEIEHAKALSSIPQLFNVRFKDGADVQKALAKTGATLPSSFTIAPQLVRATSVYFIAQDFLDGDLEIGLAHQKLLQEAQSAFAGFGEIRRVARVKSRVVVCFVDEQSAERALQQASTLGAQLGKGTTQVELFKGLPPKRGGKRAAKRPATASEQKEQEPAPKRAKMEMSI